MNAEDSHQKIGELLNAHEEWLLNEPSSGKSFALRRDEIELVFEREKRLVSFLNEKGFQTWRIVDWKFEKGRIHFDLTRNFGKERRKIKLIPRIQSAALAEEVELARVDKANKIAGLIVESLPKTKLIRVNLNEETGRFARIILENALGKQIAALADVSGEATGEKLLTTAILWLENLQRRKRNSVGQVWIVAERKISPDLRKLQALLRENWRLKIKVYEISNGAADAKNELRLTNRELRLEDLWRDKPKAIQAIKNSEPTRTAQKIIAFEPEKIDVVFTKHGETLRFLGLPFARVRKISGEERAWFGTDAKRLILNEKTFDEFTDLIENLKTYRRFDSANKRHAFYASSPESWLESILRKNVTQLDANLILSPLHHQFRVSGGGERIDLLALRKDGRLVVLELKTSPDREMIFQAVNYWRKVELQRLSGNLQKAGIFGAAAISNEPALVYLVAPTLSFHRDFEFLARAVSPEIEIVRFDLNENWRENLKVMGRKVMRDA